MLNKYKIYEKILKIKLNGNYRNYKKKNIKKS